MDFKATGWFERNYKWLVAIVVIGFSGYSIYFYFTISDKSDTYIMATAYAFFLFVAGIYMNYMSNKITDQLQDRIEIYLTLRRVRALFKARTEESALDYDGIKRRIINFQVFTGRAEVMKGENAPPYIKERGIKFDASELQIENNFLELHASLLESLNTIVKSYIEENNISTNVNYPSVHDIGNFKPEIWCKQYLGNYDVDGKEMINYLYAKIKNLDDKYSELEKLGTRITKLYKSYFNRAETNLKHIEIMYGRKLQHIISQQSEIQENFEYLFKSLNEMEDRITGTIEEHDDKIEHYVENLEPINTTLENLSVDVNEIREIVSGLDSNDR